MVKLDKAMRVLRTLEDRAQKGVADAAAAGAVEYSAALVWHQQVCEAFEEVKAVHRD